MRLIAATFLFALLFSITVFGQSATLFREPTISETQIAFSYGGDLWSVPKNGGRAIRLTSGVGIESSPYFSPDGNWIAFTGQYDGNTDVYVIPANGGVPKRLTYHPSGDSVSGWTADGKQVLFSSSRNSYAGFSRLYKVSAMGGGMPEMVPLPMGRRGSLSPDSTKIAYEPLSQWQGDWKYYKGGQTQPIWIAKLSDSSITKIPRNNSNDKHPMWIGNKIYFLSDRDNGVVTLFEYDLGSKRVSKVINNRGLDIKWATSNGNEIVYEQFGTIFRMQAGQKRATKVNITVAGDFPGVRPSYVNVGRRISNAAISPSGARAVFEARGEIFTAPADKGNARNITNTVDTMERSPAWSPDGKWIAHMSDASGEYKLHLRDQTGVGEKKEITLGEKPGFFGGLTWSPDSKKIAYTDNHLGMWFLDVESGTNTKIDVNPIGVQDGVLEPSWSPDSNWIAYTKQLPNRLRAVFLYSIKDKKISQITDGLGDARDVTFDRGGKYLYFSASTDVGPTISFADLSGIDHQTTRSIYAIVLPDNIPSPLAPESDEEKVKVEKPKPKPTPKKADDKESGDKTADAKPADDKKAAPPKKACSEKAEDQTNSD